MDFLRGVKSATIMEYILIAALIAVAIVAAFMVIVPQCITLFQ